MHPKLIQKRLLIEFMIYNKYNLVLVSITYLKHCLLSRKIEKPYLKSLLKEEEEKEALGNAEK
jgi:hypothetical protein